MNIKRNKNKMFDTSLHLLKQIEDHGFSAYIMGGSFKKIVFLIQNMVLVELFFKEFPLKLRLFEVKEIIKIIEDLRIIPILIV